VVIEGPKWCGKTWTSLRHAESMVSLTDPTGGFAARELALADPAAILTSGAASRGRGRPLLIDEWQEAPGLWDAARHTIDAVGQKGQFILTSSASPADSRPRHSGAGRMARLRMRTRSLLESGDSSGACSLQGLLAGEPPPSALPDLTVRDVIVLATRGGWPEASDDGETSLDLPRHYLRALTESEVPHLARLNPSRTMALLRSLARNTATTVTHKTLAADMAGGREGAELARATVARYLDALSRVFVLEEIPAWSPGLRSRTRLRTSAELHLTDPSLAVAALRARPQALLRDLETFGLVFETLCLRDLAVYSTAIGAELFHYRDSTGLEVDAVIEGDDGAWGAIEIKLGAHAEDRAATALLRLQRKMIAGGVPAPAFLAIVTATGATHRRADGVICAPISAFGP